MEMGRQIAIPKTIKETRRVLGDKVFGFVFFNTDITSSDPNCWCVSLFQCLLTVCMQMGVQHWDLRL